MFSLLKKKSVFCCIIEFVRMVSDRIPCLGCVIKERNNVCTPSSNTCDIFDTSSECVRFKTVPTFSPDCSASTQKRQYLSDWAQAPRERGYSGVSEISASLGRKEVTVRSHYLAEYITISTFRHTWNWHQSLKRRRRRREKTECSGYGHLDFEKACPCKCPPGLNAQIC